jgi:hypothetical protein
VLCLLWYQRANDVERSKALSIAQQVVVVARHLHRITMDDFPSVHALLAAGPDLDVADNTGETARQALVCRGVIMKPARVEAARRDIAKTRIDFVRFRALDVCIGLQSLRLDALQMCEILLVAAWRR